jgi:hypothetical protein
MSAKAKKEHSYLSTGAFRPLERSRAADAKSGARHVMQLHRSQRWHALRFIPLTLALGCSGTVGDAPPAPGAGASGAVGGSGAQGGSAVTGGSGGSGLTGGTGSVAGMATGGSGGTGFGATGGVPASGVGLRGTPAYHRFVRLTHEQWEASVKDLLKLAALPGLATSFAPDPPNGTFSNNERALFVSADHRTDYQRGAETLAAQVAGDAQGVSQVTGGTNDKAEFVRTFGRRVFRRPLTPAEETKYQAVFDSGAMYYASGNAFTDGVRMVIEAMLQSPHFLYRMELGADGAALNGYEIASKLSFFLRDTTPDDALLDAAAAGELATSAGVLTKATAMLDAATGQTVMARYHTELFGLARYDQIDKNATKFPGYEESMNAEFREADQRFFDRIFSSGQGVRAILTSPLAFVSAATAPFYGVTAAGSTLTEVMLGPERPGYLTRLGYLAVNANLSEPDPIHRGVDIINRLMCADLQPPSGAIPELPVAMPGQTNRERVTAHTGEGTCGEGCHSTLINPIGFAFENFDAIGQVRTMDNGKPIDTSGELETVTGMKPFSGARELAAILADDPSIHGCYSMHLAEYALARDVATNDRALVDGLEGISMNNNASIKASVLAVIGQPAFLTRTGGTP